MCTHTHTQKVQTHSERYVKCNISAAKCLKNDKNFVIYLVELCTYIIPNVPAKLDHREILFKVTLCFSLSSEPPGKHRIIMSESILNNVEHFIYIREGNIYIKEKLH